MKLRQVEKELNRSRATLKRWIYDGKMKAVKVGRDWEVPEEEVERIKKEGLR